MIIKTIWHYAFRFFESEWEMKIAAGHTDNIYYKGEIGGLSYRKAAKIAQIHPNCVEYYENSMALLFQGKGRFSSGTEDPVLALESYKTKSESEKDMPYILIWRMLIYK